QKTKLRINQESALRGEYRKETRHSGAQLPSHCRELAEISNTSKPLKEQNDRSYEEPNDRTSNAYTPWVPDPVTGYYRPENRAKELDPPGIFRLDPLGIRFAAWSSLLSREWRSGTRVDDAGIALCYTGETHLHMALLDDKDSLLWSFLLETVMVSRVAVLLIDDGYSMFHELGLLQLLCVACISQAYNQYPTDLINSWKRLSNRSGIMRVAAQIKVICANIYPE
ncbi:hypothetical protein RJ640_003155, partial [Escallonia rubra]